METATNLRKMFDKGAIPLVKIPAPKTRFLDGDFGRAVNDAVQSKYGKVSAINRVAYKNGVEGSNPFYVAAVNEVISPEGLRTATPADLEKAIGADMDLSGFYVDSALVLRSAGEPNKYLANDLMQQIRKRLDKKVKTPVMIPLSGTKLRVDSKSEYGLGFELKNNAEIIYAPQLSGENNNKNFLKTNEQGLPIFDKEGKRTLYTSDSGLSGLFLFRYSDLDSVDEYLDVSNGGGRVVVVSLQGDAKNLDKYITQLEQEKAKQIVEVEKRFVKAVSILKGS